MRTKDLLQRLNDYESIFSEQEIEIIKDKIKDRYPTKRNKKTNPRGNDYRELDIWGKHKSIQWKLCVLDKIVPENDIIKPHAAKYLDELKKNKPEWYAELETIKPKEGNTGKDSKPRKTTHIRVLKSYTIKKYQNHCREVDGLDHTRITPLLMELYMNDKDLKQRIKQRYVEKY